jgi:hypothetical protein
MQYFTRPTLSCVLAPALLSLAVHMPNSPSAAHRRRVSLESGTKSKADYGLPEDKGVAEWAAEKYSVSWQACFD